MSSITLYDYWRSSASYRVRIVLALKNIEYKKVAVNLLTQEECSVEYKKINPQGLVPSLVVDGTVFTQSLAICDWLDVKHPSPPLLGSDAHERAKILQCSQILACDTHPLSNVRVLKYLEAQFNATQNDKFAWMEKWVTESFAALEIMAGKNYLVGNDVSMAEVFLLPQWYNAVRFEIKLDAFPKLRSVVDRCNQQEPFKIAYPQKS